MSRVEPSRMSQTISHLPRNITIPSQHLPSVKTKSSWRLPSSFIFWLIKFHITLTPPLSRVEPSQISQTILHHPSKNETYHLYISWVFDRGTSSQRWEGVCHHGGGSRGGLGHWPSPILPWPVAKTPPAPSPVVARTLPSLDWGLWGLTFLNHRLIIWLESGDYMVIICWLSSNDHLLHI